jgi:esterase/lipase superfamily enzyme
LGDETVGEEECLDLVTNAISRLGVENVLFYIHGFNNGFDYAVRSAIRLAHDTAFRGAVIVWSWPAESSVPNYFFDAETVDLVSPRISNFLATLLIRRPTVTFDFVAHSMGARILLATLTKIAATDAVAARIHSVVFAAPDVAQDIFRARIEEARSATRRPPLYQLSTLYGSDADWALRVSKRVHRTPRAGAAGADMLVFEGVESIDASELTGGLAAHSYLLADTRALRDLSLLLGERFPASRRRLEERQKGPLKYWLLR